MMIVKGIVKGKAATALMLVFIVLCLASVALVRCQPVERDIEIECKWKGAPVNANLKWTEPEEDPVMISNADNGSKLKSGTISSQASTINTQQALMLTGASAGAALAGGSLLVKKKLESSSEKEISQTASTTTTTSTSSTSSTAPIYTSDSARSYREGLESNKNELKSSSQDQSSTQTQSNIQKPTKDNGPPTALGQQYMKNQMNSQSSQQSQSTTQTQRLEQSGMGSQNELTASNLAASAAVVTKELLMQKQMESITKQSASSTSAQTGGAQQSTQITASSTTSQNLGLLASSSSAAQMAAEMWPQRQKEFERLAKQRAELAEKFSVPSYCTGLAYPFTNSSGNAWARLQGVGSAIGNGIEKMGVAIKPYTPYIAAAACITILIASIFFTGGATAPTAPTILAGGGVSISIGQGAGLVGTGIVVTGLGLYAAHNLGIMNYPRQSSFEAKHTQIIEQSTSELREEKGSGSYGEDVAQEQLDQVEIGKDRIIQPESEDHIEAKYDAELWLREEMGETHVSPEIKRTVYDSINKRYFEVQPDLTSKRYIVECKTGRETDFKRIRNQAYEYILLAKQEGRTLVYWIDRKPLPGDKEYWDILRQLYNAGVVVLKGPFGRDIFGGG